MFFNELEKLVGAVGIRLKEGVGRNMEIHTADVFNQPRLASDALCFATDIGAAGVRLNVEMHSSNAWDFKECLLDSP
jgi:hypothetical protein